MLNRTQLKILAFDLGANLGVSYSKFNIAKNILNVVDTKLISISDFRKDNHLEIDYCSSGCLNTLAFENIVEGLIQYYQDIDIFVSEDVFVHPHRINAFKSLLLYLNKLEELVVVKRKMKLFKIPPRVIKQTLTLYGGANKQTMADHIYNNSEIKLKKKMMYKLSEHEIDSIAVAYTFCKNFMNLMV